MFDTTDQILRQLRAGEDGRAEFKELFFGERGVISPNTEDFASEMVAFANGVGGALFIVVVPRGMFVHGMSGGRYHVRFGSTRRRLTGPELARLFQERGRGYVFDEQQVFSGTVENLDWNHLEAFFGRIVYDMYS